MIFPFQASMPWNEPTRGSLALWLHTSDLPIRRFQAHQLLECLKVWRAATQKAHDFLPAEVRRAQFRQLRRRQIAEAETWVWLEATEVLGFISLPEPGFVGGLFVHPSAQQRGVGRALIEHARRRHKQLLVDVYQKNGSARAFYRSLGFRALSESQSDGDGQPYPIERLQR